MVPRENSSVPAFEEDLSIASDNLTKVISSDRGLKSMGLIFDEVLSLSFIGTGTLYYITYLKHIYQWD